jgi:hypothetical protein
MKVGWCQWNGGVAWRCQGAASRGGGSATRDCQTKHTAALPCTCHDRAGHSANQGHIAGRGNSWGHVDHSETVTGRAARPDYWVDARYQRPHDDLVLQMTDVKALYGHNRRRQPLRVQSMAAVTAEPPPPPACWPAHTCTAPAQELHGPWRDFRYLTRSFPRHCWTDGTDA